MNFKTRLLIATWKLSSCPSLICSPFSILFRKRTEYYFRNLHTKTFAVLPSSLRSTLTAVAFFSILHYVFIIFFLFSFLLLSKIAFTGETLLLFSKYYSLFINCLLFCPFLFRIGWLLEFLCCWCSWLIIFYIIN